MSNSLLSEKIAIVGIGCVFPDAPDVDAYWNNIVNKKVSIGPVEEQVFDRKAHFDSGVFGKADKNDKSYTEIGSSSIKLNFDGVKFKIPPATAKHMDDNQKIALLSTDQALKTVNYEKWNRDKVSVFIGTSLGGKMHQDFQCRTNFNRFEYHLKSHPDFQVLSNEKQLKILKDLSEEMKSGTFTVTEDSAPGILPNIVAARIAATFDFHGHAYTIDAACASSIAAIINGIQHLSSGESDAVICGGADMLNGELGRVYFSGINALSPTGSYPFDKRANGFVIGEGGGVVILKRLTDAVADGDTILCTIIGYGHNSDGKGKSIAAPNSKWQAKAIQQAIEMSAVPAETIELIEAHGTSTVVGDKSEIDALKVAFGNLGVVKKNFCAVGSAKSNIGHLKSAAGIAGVVKTILALKNRVLPPTASCEVVNPNLGVENSPFYINTEMREWKNSSYPRRAGVNSFGFGGANYHLLLEEFQKEQYVPKIEIKQMDEHSPAALWVSASDVKNLNEKLDVLSSQLQYDNVINQNAIADANYAASAQDRHRLALYFNSVTDFKSKVEFWKTDSLRNNPLQLKAKGIFYKESAPITPDKTAFLFPGQGSQYPDMLLKLQSAYPATRQLAIPMDICWKDITGERIRDLIDSGIRGKEETASLLKNTRNTHPAMLYSCLIMHKLLQDLGVNANFLAGHSLGEIIALTAAGALSITDAISIMDKRSRSFTEMESRDFGRMIALQADIQSVKKLISESGLDIYLANINSKEQIIVSGRTDSIGSFCKFIKGQKVQYVELKVSHAFHSPIVEDASVRFRNSLNDIHFNLPSKAVYSNEQCKIYPAHTGEIREILQSQIVAPVNFMGTIESLYEKGVRLFIEVGPGNVLSKLTQSILNGKEHSVVSTNTRDGNEVESFQKVLASLFAEGVDIKYLPPAGSQHNTSCVNSLQPAQIEMKSDSFQYSKRLDKCVSEKPIRVMYSGVSVGLPGSYKKSFMDDNFDQLFDGRNFIERLTDAEKEKLVELNVTKVEKTSQGPAFRLLDSLSDVIQLAGKLGQIDPLNDYGWDPKEIEQMSSAIQHGIAAGYEALRDAQIPLVRQYTKTASGGILPDRWTLPKNMQKRTGVIFAHSFPMVESVIAEVSRHISFKYGNKLRNELIEFYESLLPKVKDLQAKKLLTDWFALNHNRLSGVPSDSEVFRFNHQFINQISSLSNNRIAQYVQALGPNFQIDAACSSTTTAITLAEEMIKSGRVDRMLIIASDEATSELSLPYLGAGFLSTGAATCEADLHSAAIPFDQRRNGMIMSSGAVALVVESLSEVQKRGVAPVCELLGSHVFNSGGHPSRLDVPKYADELDEFIGQMECTHNFSRHDIASKLLYMSHETYTPARGGCSEAEAVSLKHAFGSNYTKIEVTNTKGMTGHTMGTSIEDVVAARALQVGRVPPIVNYKVPDPKLLGLKLSKGGNHQCEYALRMAAGFGSQGNYLLLKKWDNSNQSRIDDPIRYQNWLNEISGHEEASLEITGRVLRVVDKKNDNKGKTKSIGLIKTPALIKPSIPVSHIINDRAKITLLVISEITGYPPEMIKEDMEMESDLGIDTVKQATILSTLSERFSMTEIVDFQMSAYPTVGHIIKFFANGLQAENRVETDQSSDNPRKPVQKKAEIGRRADEVLQVIAEITGYPSEMIEKDMEMESDLGIDTVKQATILATLSERFGMTEKVDFQMSAYPTVGHLMILFDNGSQQEESVENPLPHRESTPVAEPQKNGVRTKDVVQVIAEITGYPPEMIEEDMEMESDLGIDTVKQATILATLSERFGMTEKIDFRMSTYPTVGHLINLFNNGSQQEESVEKPVLRRESLSVEQSEKNGVRTKDVIQVIAEITGYPPEMIEEDMEMESDLGIDTVKQATILATLSERFGMTEMVDFQMSAYPTVGHLISLFNNGPQLEIPVGKSVFSGNSTLIPLTARLDSLTDQTVQDSFHLQSHVLEFQNCNLSDATNDLSKLTLCVLCNDISKDNGAVDYFKPIFKSVKIVDVSSIDSHNLSADVWIDIGIYSMDISSQSVAIQFKKILEELLGNRFDLCVKCGGKLPERILLCRTRGKNAWNNLLQGFYQSIAKEWKIKFSSLEVKESDTITDYWCHVERELRSGSEGIRILIENNNRYVHRIVVPRFEDNLQSTIQMWSESDVILVSGGGNGITSRIAVELASIIPAKYVILGRSELLQDDYTTELWKEENLDKRKKEIIDQLKKTGKRVTPALIDSALENALKQRELQLTLKSIKKMGRNLMYLNCDITDFARLSECVKDINSKWGPVTGILHGAGFEKSQYINKKTRSEFFGIVDVKVLGSLYLKELCPVEKLKMWVSLSSISGVFGNEAQTDYAAANAFLQGDAEDIATVKTNIQSVSLAWSGWADLGMAWRNTYVRQNADSIGLFLIPPKIGAKAAVSIITRENRYKTFILHGGLGQMVTNDWQEKMVFKAPLLDRIEIADKSILRAYKTISPSTDEWINQHRLEDVPLAPGVGMIELMAETFAQTCHIEGGLKFENISFHDAFKLYKCQPREIYVEAKAIYSSKQPMRIYSEFISRMIKKPELRDYSAALVSTVKDRPPIFDMGLLYLENSKRIFYEELLNKLNTISHNVIFGPLFHDSKRDGYIKNTDWVEWNSDSVHTLHSFPMEQILNPNYHLKDYVFNFCLLDSIHQTGVIHTILNSGHVHLPLSAREFVVFGKQDKPGNYYTFAKLVNKTDNTFVYDIYLLDSQKEVCAYALGSTYHRLQG